MPFHQDFLKRERRQSDINRNAVRRLKEQDSISTGKLPGIRDPSQVSRVQQRRGYLVLASKRTQQVTSTPRVNRGSPQRTAASPPMKQNLQPRVSSNV
jgi:hypothetical protein